MKTILTHPIMCQSRGCTEKATWREIDKYTQPGQKQKQVFFYYMCDEHKCNQNIPGHERRFQRIL